MTTTSQNKCDATTSENTLSTSGKARVEKKFKLLDLHRLTFQLEGQEPVLNVETATPEQFNAFASEMADIEDVDVKVWPLEVRRDFVNHLWNYCLTEGYDFPLMEVEDKPAQEGEPHATKV